MRKKGKTEPETAGDSPRAAQKGKSGKLGLARGRSFLYNKKGITPINGAAGTPQPCRAQLEKRRKTGNPRLGVRQSGDLP